MLICNALPLLDAAYRERDIYLKHPDGGCLFSLLFEEIEL